MPAAFDHFGLVVSVSISTPFVRSWPIDPGAVLLICRLARRFFYGFADHPPRALRIADPLFEQLTTESVNC